MTTIHIRGIPVSFPFKPYDIQKNYMEKVIECLQNETNGVLESPTGTGKTLSLLCSSLAWLSVQKAKYQAEARNCGEFFTKDNNKDNSKIPKFMWDVPVIIYASRTHSQLTQAMQELKRTSYKYVRATVVGSRDQMCIHPEVSKQPTHTNKIHMCQALVKTRSCYLHNRVEKMSCSGQMQEMNVADIEDLIKLGEKHKFCPFYMARDLKKGADIMFLPYNYLLDPKARRSQQLDLKNSVIIFDEAHNVERICEDSASFQLRSTDITLCIEEITQIMKHIDALHSFSSGDESQDFSPEDLMFLKTMLLHLEKAIDEIPIQNQEEGTTYEGKYIFDVLEKAGINDVSQGNVVALLDRLIEFISTSKESPFQRTGVGLQLLQDLLLIVYQKVSVEFKTQINKCYKVHIIEEFKKKDTADTWLSKATKSKSVCRVLSYWCFSPNFGMQMLLEQGVRCIILTSGTLAPLKPLITELGIDIGVRLENPHVVNKNQICVKIVPSGPDGIALNAGFQNRDNQKYINSLGMTILNISRQIPHGLLIFFPSYFVLSKCKERWQETGIWGNINDQKMIFVEPKTKDTFSKVMTDFYDQVKNPVYKGAIFMAVCRGKVSEGLDFTDLNGRGVMVTGLPYPPYKDPRVVLKKRYLDVCRAKDPEYLSGQEWYNLEATRAVNQAIGRIIRHRYDYGVILLLDNRFDSFKVKNQLSLWLRDQISLAKNFGEIIKEVRLFFQNASSLDQHQKEYNVQAITNKFDVKINEENQTAVNSYPSTSTSNLLNDQNTNKRNPLDVLQKNVKRRKINLVATNYEIDTPQDYQQDPQLYIKVLKKNLTKELYIKFTDALTKYKTTSDITLFIKCLTDIFGSQLHLRYLIQGIYPYIKSSHQERFQCFWESMR